MHAATHNPSTLATCVPRLAWDHTLSYGSAFAAHGCGRVDTGGEGMTWQGHGPEWVWGMAWCIGRGVQGASTAGRTAWFFAADSGG